MMRKVGQQENTGRLVRSGSRTRKGCAVRVGAVGGLAPTLTYFLPFDLRLVGS